MRETDTMIAFSVETLFKSQDKRTSLQCLWTLNIALLLVGFIEDRTWPTYRLYRLVRETSA